MSAYNLTEDQKQLLRKLVDASKSGAREFTWFSTFGGSLIEFPGELELQIEASFADMEVLHEGGFISFTLATRSAGGGSLRQRGIDAVASDFPEPPAPVPAQTFNVTGGTFGAFQVATHANATVNQTTGATPGGWLERLTQLEEEVSGLDRRDRDLLLILHELVEGLREAEAKPEEARGKLAAIFDRAKPWVELVTAIVSLKADGK